MAKPDIFMPFYIRDYVMDTLHLTLEEDCCYRRLLDVYWLGDAKGLPDNDADLARMIRVEPTVWQRLKPRVISFFIPSGGVLRNPKADKVYLEALAAMEASSKAGKKAAAARWKKDDDANAHADALPPHMPAQCSSPVKSSTPVTVPSNPSTRLVVQAQEALSGGQEPILEDFTEQQVLDYCHDLFGKEFMEKHGGSWRKRFRERRAVLFATLRELREMQRTGKPIKHPGACGDDLFKRFAGMKK